MSGREVNTYLGGWHISAIITSCSIDALILFLLFSCPAAPSIVPIMHQISSTMNSFTLSWPQPEQPNGIILDYELRYYEKVGI